MERVNTGTKVGGGGGVLNEVVHRRDGKHGNILRRENSDVYQRQEYWI